MAFPRVQAHPRRSSRVGVPFRALGKAAGKRRRVLEHASVFADPLVFGDEVASEETPAGHPNAAGLDVNSRQLRLRREVDDFGCRLLVTWSRGRF